MNTETPVIEIQNLVRRYGKQDAVDGLSLTVQPGKCYGFFGRNGAGKTTTIKCLLNLLRADSGSVRVFGLDPCGLAMSMACLPIVCRSTLCRNVSLLTASG